MGKNLFSQFGSSSRLLTLLPECEKLLVATLGRMFYGYQGLSILRRAHTTTILSNYSNPLRGCK